MIANVEDSKLLTLEHYMDPRMRERCVELYEFSYCQRHASLRIKLIL